MRGFGSEWAIELKLSTEFPFSIWWKLTKFSLIQKFLLFTFSKCPPLLKNIFQANYKQSRTLILVPTGDEWNKLSLQIQSYGPFSWSYYWGRKETLKVKISKNVNFSSFSSISSIPPLCIRYLRKSHLNMSLSLWYIVVIHYCYGVGEGNAHHLKIILTDVSK